MRLQDDSASNHEEASIDDLLSRGLTIDHSYPPEDDQDDLLDHE